ncbi:MAG: hypothetical protein H6828_09080 [Planctomycetes bacterium]|nr:hypothetical protein [Planctomycetota bacterium]
MNRLRPLAPLALLALALALPAAARQADAPQAPDGHPGLGTARTSHEFLQLFVSPDADEERLLLQLQDLESEVRILREMARRTYVERGYFRLVDRYGPQDLATLHRRFREQTPHGPELAGLEGPEEEAWGDMFVDLRFRARMDLLGDFEQEARDLRSGLALLRGLSDGWVEMKDVEARAIAARVDLSAALLRAMRLDLEALRERGDADAPGQPDPAWRVELIGITKLRGTDERRAAFERLTEKLAAREEQLESVLFTPRLRARLDTELRRRDAQREKARELLEEARTYLLELVDTPPEVLRLSKTQRYQIALRLVLEGIGYDPFLDGLAYRAGVTTDLLYEARESRQWYDRFLALRGIRVHLSETTERELDGEEREALAAVLRGAVLPGR